jgi:hypothetical protein
MLFEKAHRSILLKNIDASVSNKILANKIKQQNWSSFPESNGSPVLGNISI